MPSADLTVQDIRRTVADFAPAYDISKAYLFGSCARGEATISSDVDLCLETGPNFSLFNAGSFVTELEQALGTNIDVVTEKSVYPHVKNGLLKDRVLVYEQA